MARSTVAAPLDRLDARAPESVIARAPHVSVVVPVYNAVETIERAVRSALEQTYEDLEVVVVDNRSTDGTLDRIRAIADPRLQVYVNPRNLGALRNQNRAVELARGQLIKPLHADDVLLAPCVERMAALFDAHDRLGLVFAPRRVELVDEASPTEQAWRDAFGELHRGFGSLTETNDGRALLEQYLTSGGHDNWIGEPSSVMVRRSAFERLGLFSERVRRLNDMEMWARLMTRYDVGFVDEPLTVYRAGGNNLTQEIFSREDSMWLDRVWMYEALALARSEGELPVLDDCLAVERRRALKRLVRMGVRRPAALGERIRELREYLKWIAGGRGAVHPPLAPVASEAADRNGTAVAPPPELDMVKGSTGW